MSIEADWDAIELDYRAGILPATAIAKKHGVSQHTLRSHADKYFWERKPVDPLSIQNAHGIASTAPSAPKFGMDSVLVPEDLKLAAALTAASVLDVHRKDVKQLREAAGKFSDTLASLFSALDKEPLLLDSTISKLSILIGDDAPVDLLEKLSRVMVRLVTIERQAYGLDVLPNPDPGNDNGEAARSEVTKLWDQIKELQAQKTQSVH